jgi:hypothetical protein
MHYILKLPGTIAQVVNYPTTNGPYNSANEASLMVEKINKRLGHTDITGVPLPERKEAA